MSRQAPQPRHSFVIMGITSRPGQAASLSTLAEFDPAVVDMHTLVVVGSSRTRVQAGRMVTPRDYKWAQ